MSWSRAAWVASDDSKLHWISRERVDKFVDATLWQSTNLNHARNYTWRKEIDQLTVWHTDDTDAASSLSSSPSAFVSHRPSFSTATLSSNVYSAARVGSSFGPSWSTHWFKIKVNIPPDWKDKYAEIVPQRDSSSTTAPPVHLLWNSNCECAVWSKDGCIMQGLTGGNGDDARTAYIVPPTAVRAGVFECYIEMACNGLFGVGEGFIGPPNPTRTFTLSQAEIGLFDAEYYQLLFTFTQLRDMCRELGGNTDTKTPATARGLQALTVAHEVMNSLDTHDRRTWAPAIQRMNFFFAHCNGTSAPFIHAIGHCHIDTAWLWPYAETKRKVARSWSTQLDLLTRYPEYRFAASQAQQYAWMKESYPELFSRIKTAVSQGRFLPQGGSWVESDCNLPCGESLVRQLLYGQRFFMSEFGVQNTIYWLPDTFGYCAQLPQILCLAGFKYFLTQKLSWSLMTQFPHHTFIWRGIDGTKILTHFPPNDDYNSKADVRAILKASTKNKSRGLAPDCLMLFGHGDGGGGPDQAMLDRIERLRDVDGLGARIEFSTPEKLFASLEAETKKSIAADGRALSGTSIAASLPVWSGELYLELHRGTYTTGGAIKYANRVCENLLKEVELWSSFAAILQSSSSSPPFVYPAAPLERLWKLVLLNQFHDVLPCSCIHEAINDALQAYHQVWTECRSLLIQAYVNITQRMSPSSPSSSASFLTDSIRIFNYPHFPTVPDIPALANYPGPPIIPAPFAQFYAFNAISLERPFDIVELPPSIPLSSSHMQQRLRSGSNLAVIHTPGLGVQSMAGLLSGQIPSPVSLESGSKADGFIIRNSLIRMHLSMDGRIHSLYDLESDREVLQSGTRGNNLVMYDDVPFFWDAWDVEVYHLQQRRDVAPANSVRVIESGPLRVSIQMEYTLSPASHLTQVMHVHANTKRIEFESVIDWHESHQLLKVEFPCDVLSTQATYDIQYGHISRATHCNTPADLGKFEVCAQSWADLSESGYGVALIAEAKHGFACHDNVLRLSLLRSPKKPDADIDMGRHLIRYALLPHEGGIKQGRVIAEAKQFNQRTKIVLSSAMPSNSAPLSSTQCMRLLAYQSSVPDSVIIDCIKQSEREKDSWVIRMHEAFGGRAHISLGQEPVEHQHLSVPSSSSSSSSPTPATAVCPKVLASSSVLHSISIVDVLERPLDSSTNLSRMTPTSSSTPSCLPLRVSLKPFELVTCELKLNAVANAR